MPQCLFRWQEWTKEEVAMGLHKGAMDFANESRSQRCGASRDGLLGDNFGCGNVSVQAGSMGDSSISRVLKFLKPLPPVPIMGPGVPTTPVAAEPK